MNVCSLYSGIGGFDLAFERAGHRVVCQVETDKTCNAVLARHWPDVPRYGDVREVSGHDLAQRHGPIDVLVGGFPCQDLSVAGNRAGLAGERSGLWWEIARLLDELRPPFCVIENVPGLLSSNRGRDMGTILWELGRLGYGYAYRVLDAQWAGLAQRRDRVFIVGSLGDWTRAAQILLEPEGSPGDSPPSREAEKGVARTLTGGTDDPRWHGKESGADRRTLVVNALESVQGGPDDNMAQAGHLVALPLTAHPHRDGDRDTNYVTGPVTGAEAHNGNSNPVPDNYVVTHTLRSEGADASEDGTGRGVPLVAGFHWQASAQQSMNPASLSPSLDKSKVPAVAFTERSRNAGRTLESQEEIAYALTNPGSGGRTHSRQLYDGLGVRRLMPVECERLQGFPDGWTAFDGDGKPLSDSARYRMLGNAVAVPVVYWIARRMPA